MTVRTAEEILQTAAGASMGHLSKEFETSLRRLNDSVLDSGRNVTIGDKLTIFNGTASKMADVLDKECPDIADAIVWLGNTQDAKIIDSPHVSDKSIIGLLRSWNLARIVRIESTPLDSYLLRPSDLGYDVIKILEPKQRKASKEDAKGGAQNAQAQPI